MAGSTFQPPINLDPHQDPSQQTAFINQNFQSLSSALETNSFRVVKKSTLIVKGFSFSAGAGTYAQGGNTASVAHNLGYKPAVIAYFSSPTSTDIDYQIPHSTISSLSSTGFSFSFIEAGADATNLYASVNMYGINSSYTWADITILYYLLQATTN